MKICSHFFNLFTSYRFCEFDFWIDLNCKCLPKSLAHFPIKNHSKRFLQFRQCYLLLETLALLHLDRKSLPYCLVQHLSFHPLRFIYSLSNINLISSHFNNQSNYLYCHLFLTGMIDSCSTSDYFFPEINLKLNLFYSDSFA